MTHKEKIRKEVEKLKSQLLRGACSSQVTMETHCKEEAYNEVLAVLDTMQEEPVSEDFEEALAREWQGYNDRGAATVDALEDNTQELAFAKGFYRGSNWQKQKDSIPVSGDLEEASLEYFKQALKDGDKTKLDAFKAGAQWQKEKEYTCYEEAFEDGAKWKMEQMMNNSVDAYLERDLGGQLIIGKANSPAGDEFMLLNSYSFPEIKCGKKCKVKLVIIKKDLL